MSLEASDQKAAAHAVAPRVTLADINAAIAAMYTFTAAQAVDALHMPRAVDSSLGVVTICIVVMKNGFTVIGKSAPASPENFNAELGAEFARDDAIRQLWPLMGFALKDRLAGLA